jgi:hypothetical protein
MVKIFEQYISMAEMLPILRSIAVKIIQNDLNIANEEGSTCDWEKFTLKVTMCTSMYDQVQQMAVDIYLDGKKIGSVNVDFDNIDDIVVEFEINFENDGYTFNEKKFELFDKSLMVTEKLKPVHKPILSEPLSK